MKDILLDQDLDLKDLQTLRESTPDWLGDPRLLLTQDRWQAMVTNLMLLSDERNSEYYVEALKLYLMRPEKKDELKLLPIVRHEKTGVPLRRMTDTIVEGVFNQYEDYLTSAEHIGNMSNSMSVPQESAPVSRMARQAIAIRTLFPETSASQVTRNEWVKVIESIVAHIKAGMYNSAVWQQLYLKIFYLPMSDMGAECFDQRTLLAIQNMANAQIFPSVKVGIYSDIKLIYPDEASFCRNRLRSMGRDLDKEITSFSRAGVGQGLSDLLFDIFTVSADEVVVNPEGISLKFIPKVSPQEEPDLPVRRDYQ